MGGCRCSYKSCIRATKNSEKDFHFFHYPVKDPERCLKWINNAKKSHFQNLPEDQLRNKVVCQLHFELPHFTNTSRKRLVHDAVPTLDAGSEDAKNEEINLQVLQSDSEGNVFTVDTENLMQTEVKDVTSYIIQNGNLVPADLPDGEIIPDIVNPVMYNISVAERIVDPENVVEVNNDQQFVSQKFNQNNSEKSGKIYSFTDRQHWPKVSNTLFKYDETLTPIIFDPQLPLLEIVEDKVITNVLPLESNVTENTDLKPAEQINTKENSNDLEVVNLSKTIQQHSREIACLKRILKTKMKRTRSRKRLTNIQIINNLRGLIPPTLHGAISLHLFKKEKNFTKDEKDFLTSLYNASPSAYEVFLKDCKWKLPDLDTVKKLISNKNRFR